MNDPMIILGGAAVVTVCGAVGSMALSCFRKCRPNQAMIISGLGAGTDAGGVKIVMNGGGAVVWPVIQQCAYLSLETYKLRTTPQTPYETKDRQYVKIQTDSQVKVKADVECVIAAAELLLDKSDHDIAMIADVVIVGHMRAIIGTMTYEDLLGNLDQFAMRVQEVSIYDLKKYGMTVVSLHITECSRYEETSTIASEPTLAEQANR